MNLRDDVVNRLQETGLRLTHSRLVIVDAIVRMDHPFQVSELWDAVHRAHATVGRASVFRTLALLVDLGVVARLHGANSHERYIVCGGATHHHHVTCTGCGRTDEFVLGSADGLEDLVANAVGLLGYRPRMHIVEVYGLCPACRTEGAGGR